MRLVSTLAAAAFALACTPAAWAQEATAPAQGGERESVFSGDYLVVGVLGAVTPSYDGSDDYVVTAYPLVQGSFKGVGFSPSAGGLTLDFINDRPGSSVQFSFGPTARIRSNRDGRVKDDVVKLLPDLDTAIEVGPSVGVTFPGVLNPYDGLSFSANAKWDVAGAHEGMTIAPSVSYRTPLSRGTLAVLSVGAEYADDDFMDYYYTVTPEASAVTGLPVFQAEGGFRSVGANLLMGFDLNGNLEDGGLAVFAIAGYSRMLGDAKDTPFTSIRGSADQWTGGVGLAYTF